VQEELKKILGEIDDFFSFSLAKKNASKKKKSKN